MKRSPSGYIYTDVPGLDSVIFSPDALRNLQEARVADAELSTTLEHGTDVRARTDHAVVGREWMGIRLVIKTFSTPGLAAVCVNGYRVTE